MKKLSLAIATMALAAVPAGAVAPAPTGAAKEGAKEYSSTTLACALLGYLDLGRRVCGRKPA